MWSSLRWGAYIECRPPWSAGSPAAPRLPVLFCLQLYSSLFCLECFPRRQSAHWEAVSIFFLFVILSLSKKEKCCVVTSLFNFCCYFWLLISCVTLCVKVNNSNWSLTCHGSDLQWILVEFPLKSANVCSAQIQQFAPKINVHQFVFPERKH